MKEFALSLLLKFWLFEVILYPVSERNQILQGQSITGRTWFISYITALKTKFLVTNYNFEKGLIKSFN